MASIDQLEKRVKRLKRNVRELEGDREKVNTKLDRCKLLLDNLTRACERMDTQAIDQTARAGRDFIVQNPL